MPLYIRFLKPPRITPINPSKSSLRTVLAITNDLGEPSPYPHPLTVTLYDFGSTPDSGVLRSTSRGFQWTPGMAALKVDLTAEWSVANDADVVVYPDAATPPPSASSASSSASASAMRRNEQAVVDVVDFIQAHRVVLGASNGSSGHSLPGLIGASASVDEQSRSGNGRYYSTRLFALGGESLGGDGDHTSVADIEVAEEIGDHRLFGYIWDGGLTMTSLLAQAFRHHGYGHGLGVSQAASSLKVLELGAGTGLVGSAFGALVPEARVLLTDVEGAMDVLNETVNANLERNLDGGIDLDYRMLHDATYTDQDNDDQYLEDEDEEENEVVNEHLNAAEDGDEDDTPRLSCTPVEWSTNQNQVSLWSTPHGKFWDLVLVTDCNYNPDSHDALLTTLKTLITSNSSCLILLATKKRHESEADFIAKFKTYGMQTLKSWQEYLDDGIVDIMTIVGLNFQLPPWLGDYPALQEFVKP